jgi:hypothetical protein
MGKVKLSPHAARVEAFNDLARKNAAEAAEYARYEAQKKAATTELPLSKVDLAPAPIVAAQPKFLTPAPSNFSFPPARDEEMGVVQLLGIAHQVYAIAIPIGMLTLITGALAYQFWSILNTFIPAIRA